MSKVTTKKQRQTAKDKGIKNPTMYARINILGWPVELATSKPVATPKVKCYAFRVDEETNRAMVDFMEKNNLTITKFITEAIAYYLLFMDDK